MAKRAGSGEHSVKTLRHAISHNGNEDVATPVLESLHHPRMGVHIIYEILRTIFLFRSSRLDRTPIIKRGVALKPVIDNMCISNRGSTLAPE